MTNQEIKLRLVEAFIIAKDVATISEVTQKIDELVDYINKDNLEFAKQELSEEENLRKIYFDFYDKMEEPERSMAKENWNYQYANLFENPENLYWAVNKGFEFNDSATYWRKIQKKYS